MLHTDLGIKVAVPETSLVMQGPFLGVFGLNDHQSTVLCSRCAAVDCYIVEDPVCQLGPEGVQCCHRRGLPPGLWLWKWIVVVHRCTDFTTFVPKNNSW